MCYSIFKFQRYLLLSFPRVLESRITNKMLLVINSYPTAANQFVLRVGMGLDFHQILYRQILQVKGRIAFRWVVLCCHQSDYYLIKRNPRQYNKIVLLYILSYYVHNRYSGNEEISSQINS